MTLTNLLSQVLSENVKSNIKKKKNQVFVKFYRRNS